MSETQHQPKKADENARIEGASKDSISTDDEIVELKELKLKMATLEEKHQKEIGDWMEKFQILQNRNELLEVKRYDDDGQSKRFQWDQEQEDERKREVVFSEDGLTASGDVGYDIIRGKKGIALRQFDDNRCFSIQIYYFEVKIVTLSSAMSIGFAGPGFGQYRYYWGLGFWLENNGKLVYGNETSPIEGWPSYGNDDIVGSGCLLSMMSMSTEEEAEAAVEEGNSSSTEMPRFIMRPFYTLNGQLCSGSGNDGKHVPPILISSKDMERDIMKPRVCVIGAFEVRANFGHAPFLYNPHKFMAECEKDGLLKRE